jgi:TatD DNase family protein
MNDLKKLHFTDSHAHISSETLADDIEGIVERAQAADVNTIVNICTDIATLDRGLDFASRFSCIHNTAATTPHDVEKEGESVFPYIAQKAHEGHLIAIGETGLDYYYEHSAKDIQKDFLKRYLHLALETQLPVVIHCRDAFADFFEILDAEYCISGKHAPGVLHCFTGSVEEAKEVLNRGWYVSFSGIVTFKKSHDLREAAKIVPVEQMLIETDSPYLAPQKYRGKKNEPSYLPETASLLAELKGISLEELAKVTSHNAQQLFKFSPVH